MDILTQKAKKKQAVVEYAIKNKSYASQMYGHSLGSENVGAKDMTVHSSH